ncbi:hypothetical protein GVAV_001364 [Gurleya vavrai]
MTLDNHSKDFNSVLNRVSQTPFPEFVKHNLKSKIKNNIQNYEVLCYTSQKYKLTASNNFILAFANDNYFSIITDDNHNKCIVDYIIDGLFCLICNNLPVILTTCQNETFIYIFNENKFMLAEKINSKAVSCHSNKKKSFYVSFDSENKLFLKLFVLSNNGKFSISEIFKIINDEEFYHKNLNSSNKKKSMRKQKSCKNIKNDYHLNVFSNCKNKTPKDIQEIDEIDFKQNNENLLLNQGENLELNERSIKFSGKKMYLYKNNGLYSLKQQKLMHEADDFYIFNKQMLFVTYTNNQTNIRSKAKKINLISLDGFYKIKLSEMYVLAYNEKNIYFIEIKNKKGIISFNYAFNLKNICSIEVFSDKNKIFIYLFIDESLNEIENVQIDKIAEINAKFSDTNIKNTIENYNPKKIERKTIESYRDKDNCNSFCFENGTKILRDLPYNKNLFMQQVKNNELKIFNLTKKNSEENFDNKILIEKSKKSEQKNIISNYDIHKDINFQCEHDEINNKNLVNLFDLSGFTKSLERIKNISNDDSNLCKKFIFNLNDMNSKFNNLFDNDDLISINKLNQVKKKENILNINLENDFKDNNLNDKNLKDFDTKNSKLKNLFDPALNNFFPFTKNFIFKNPHTEKMNNENNCESIRNEEIMTNESYENKTQNNYDQTNKSENESKKDNSKKENDDKKMKNKAKDSQESKKSEKNIFKDILKNGYKGVEKVINLDEELQKEENITDTSFDSELGTQTVTNEICLNGCRHYEEINKKLDDLSYKMNEERLKNELESKNKFKKLLDTVSAHLNVQLINTVENTIKKEVKSGIAQIKKGVSDNINLLENKSLSILSQIKESKETDMAENLLIANTLKETMINVFLPVIESCVEEMKRQILNEMKKNVFNKKEETPKTVSMKDEIINLLQCENVNEASVIAMDCDDEIMFVFIENINSTLIDKIDFNLQSILLKRSVSMFVENENEKISNFISNLLMVLEIQELSLADLLDIQNLLEFMNELSIGSNENIKLIVKMQGNQVRKTLARKGNL